MTNENFISVKTSKVANKDGTMITGISKENLMTTKELAKALNVDISTVTKTVSRLNSTSEVLPKFKQGQTPRYTEEQATLIKQEIQKHHNLASRQIDETTSEYEMELLTQKVLAYHIQKANEYKARAEIAEHQLIEQRPKVTAYDNYLSRDKFCNFRDAASYFGVKQGELMAVLKSKYIYKNSSGEYRAYSEYSEYFTLRPFDKGVDKVGQQLMLNIKGIEFFGKIFPKKIA